LPQDPKELSSFYLKGGGFKLNEELTKLLNAKKTGLRVSSRLATEK
jgi:hypothetical protein